ncbi:hypothetical protein OOZ63_18370 [Paucibacter sp. PLA-PC-4]|uniref:hypothetical protein n=1 Tax=Paucibacter sp. PLA-PC-4 TaxID=2993655 RepID=UPI00224A57E3|nr:hypothetical protein [Paucibacter sp. PLA-PC-4]MCX2863797.1 hypothetical protein [Paucibacter sp. PLA-PC-4]
MQTRFTKQARSELLGPTACDEAVEKGLGGRFRSEAQAAAQRAKAYPLHGKPWAAGARSRLATGCSLWLLYTRAAYGVRIHVPADSRLTEYWLIRLA